MRQTRSLRILSLLVLTVIGYAACGQTAPNDTAPTARPKGCYGKCDGTEDALPPSLYTVDLAKADAIWHPTNHFESVADLFTVHVDMGQGMEFDAPTHLFGVPVNVIPYADEDNVQDAEGNTVARGDDQIARYYAVGEVGFAIKHHRPEFHLLKLAGADPADMKEHFKLQDTHIEIVVGVERDGKPGAITVNSPQDYQNGAFGNAHYPMIFVKPVYPAYLDEPLKRAFNDNIRTMILGFNAVLTFPGSYNGGDPLAANSPERVREHVAMMIRALTGDEEAKAFFEDPAHMIYCAELAFLGTTAGLLVPLNEENVVPLVGQETWEAFKQEIAKHQAGEESAFITLNANKRVAMVDVTLAPEDLLPAPEYAPEDMREEERQKLALQPMTMADIVEEFLRTHVPREILGEQIAPAQGQLLAAMKDGLLEVMGMDQLPADDPRRAAVSGLYDQIVETVSKSYEDYDAFRAALAPLLAQARQVTGPRDDTGTGLFVPPSLFHVTAQGKMLGGLIGLRYIGHGIHYSACRKKATDQDDEEEPAPAVDEDSPYAGSCRASCGGSAPDGSCFCDAACAQYEDCCEDYETSCNG